MTRGNAFLQRVRTERCILETINRHPIGRRAPLPGLGFGTVARWCARELSSELPAEVRETLRCHLVSLSERLRLASCSSHRGMLQSQPVPPSRIPDEVRQLVGILDHAEEALRVD
jgi:hypothetical protein